MEYAELYELTLQVIRERHKLLQEGKIDELGLDRDLNTRRIVQDVASRTYKLGRMIDMPTQGNVPPDPETAATRLQPEDKKTIHSILWQFVGLGLLTPRHVAEGDSHFEITPYGKHVLENTEDSPYDQFGYTRWLGTNAPQLEPPTVEYIREALSCFVRRLFRAAAVMLGVASENEILALIQLYSNTLGDTNKKAFQKAMPQRNLNEKFDYLYSRLKQDEGTFPEEIPELDTWLRGIFQVIRLHRNDAGHPSDQRPSESDVSANLNLFRTYARYLSALKKHLRNRASA